MTTTKADRKTLHSQLLKDRDAILSELHEILASPHFCNSKRYPALLEYVVENTLAGKEELLKERTIGIEVFDRPPTYDTNADTVVRFTAGEVRKRLSSFYHDRGRDSRIHISLPAGSYIPEFLYRSIEPGVVADSTSPPPTRIANDGGIGDMASNSPNVDPASTSAAVPPSFQTSLEFVNVVNTPLARSRAVSLRLLWLAMAAMALLGVVAGLSWSYWPVPHRSAAIDFWQPLLHGQGTILICAGGAAVAQNSPMGVESANKYTQYPLLTMESASSIALVSNLIETGGSTSQLRFAPSTQLAELREQPLVLLTAYNNPWTMRFTEPLRFHFAPEPNFAIIDRTRPQVHWARDTSIPYSSADDYALVARFWNPPTDSWVVVVAGLGRNGTEAAAQFTVSPKYMEMLRAQSESGFSNRNIEVVLKVSVIDGKTGAPSIMAANVW